MRACAIVALALVLGGCSASRLIGTATRSTRAFLPTKDPRVFYEAGAEERAALVGASIDAAIATVEEKQLTRFDIPVRVYVCATLHTYARHVMDARSGGHTLNNRVFISPKPENTDERIPRVLTHELSHLLLLQHLSFWRAAHLPPWFVEGLAAEVSVGGGAEGVSDEEARRMIASGHAFVPEGRSSVWHRKAAHAFGLDAHMFYRQAAMFVGYLRGLDAQRFRSLILAVERGRMLDDAHRAAFGRGLDAAWAGFLADYGK